MFIAVLPIRCGEAIVFKSVALLAYAMLVGYHFRSLLVHVPQLPGEIWEASRGILSEGAKMALIDREAPRANPNGRRTSEWGFHDRFKKQNAIPNA